jgi:hypothetical protein
LNRDPDKELVAKFIAEKLPIAEGAGLFVDAGSQCFQAYNAIARSADERDQSQLNLFTSNMFVLYSWIANRWNARTRFPTIEIAGGEVDVEHRAFYGLSDNQGFKSFRPSLVLIGASGFEVEPGRLWLGTHAGEHEIKDKEHLFRCPAKNRVILLTPGKIGQAGSRPLDLLSLEPPEEERIQAPIYIVTASPSHKQVEYRDNYANAMEAMRSEVMRLKLQRRRLTVHWVTLNWIDYQKGQLQEEVFPSKKDRNIGSLDADIPLDPEPLARV